MGLKIDLMCAVERVKQVAAECDDAGQLSTLGHHLLTRLLSCDVRRLNAHIGSVPPERELRNNGSFTFGDWILGVECDESAPYTPVHPTSILHGRAVLLVARSEEGADDERTLPGRAGIVVPGGRPHVVLPLCVWPYGADLF